MMNGNDISLRNADFNSLHQLLTKSLLILKN